MRRSVCASPAPGHDRPEFLSPPDRFDLVGLEILGQFLRPCRAIGRLRATAWAVMVPLPPCKKLSERFLQMRAFSSSLGRGPSYGGWSRVQEMPVFSCISPDALGTASRSCRHPTSQVQERRTPVWKGVRRREAVQAAVSVSTSRTGTDRLTL